MEGQGELVLMFNYPARAGKGSVKESLKVPIVTSVVRDVNVNLTELPTMIYGYRNNFCMDLGATEKVTFSCARINPFPYSDLSNDPEKWSNGKWYRHLEDLFDRWQNFGMDQSGASTGGCTMSFTPADETLMAPISGNVFLVGSLNLNYSIQKMTFTLPLQLASMKSTSGTVDTVSITLKTVTSSGDTLTTTVDVPQGFPEVIQLPSEWEDVYDGGVFSGWEYSGGFIPAGSAHTFTGPMTLTARWRKPADAVFFSSDDTFTVPMDTDQITIYAVGGGGGAGGTSHTRSGKEYIMWPGGGGGSGDVQVATVNAGGGSTLSITIGRGGKAGTSRSPASNRDGGDGEAGYVTSVSMNGSTLVRASGGAGGKGAKLNSGTGGEPGQSYCAGGAPEQDGKTGSPNIEDNVGKAGRAGTTYTTGAYPHLYRGGGGGGAARFYCRFDTDAGPRPTSGHYESRGGKGSTWEPNGEQIPAGNGYYGGGGGSGERADPLLDHNNIGDGGGGCVLIVIYKVSE